jgi:hypothetical protein
MKYGKTGSFSDAIRNVVAMATYVGKDELGNTVYDNSKPLPTLWFVGTVKLHGTNAGVHYNFSTGEITPWKRSGPANGGHYGFTEWVSKNKKLFTEFFEGLKEDQELDADSAVVYGEWAGQGIQKGVAISQIPKKFYPFAMRYIYGEKADWAREHEVMDLHSPEHGCISLPTLWRKSIKIDFSNPKAIQNKLISLTEEVENECPIAKILGDISGTGEGIVWTSFYGQERIAFKVKGEKHSVTKVKTLASVDPEKLKNIQAFVQYALTENRMKQAISEVFGESLPSKSRTGDVVKWIKNDILSEEQVTLEANNLYSADVHKALGNSAAQMFFRVAEL